MENTNQSHSQDENPKKRNNTWIYITIIALLIGTNVYLFLQKNHDNKKNLILAEQISVLDSTRLDLQNEYNASLVRLDDLTGKNARLDSLLRNSDSELSKTKSRIQEILKKQNATDKELAEAQNLIKGLNVKITDYEGQIAQLKSRNKQLEVEKDSLVGTNISLQEKVTLAEILRASNIRLSAIDLRKGGKKEKETTKAKRVDILRITFDIDENKIAESGTKELHLVISDPNGELLSNAALGSGTFVMEDGREKYYTLSKTVNLETGKPVTNINVDWQQTSDYLKGNYHVEIYCEGYLIGSGDALLR